MVDQIEIVLKVSERCNIACTYCYYFENPDKSAYGRPAVISQQVVSMLRKRIDEALVGATTKSFQVDFHGGEPLMIGKRRFVEICRTLREGLSPDQVRLCLQTNAILIDKEWIDLFAAAGINVGTSIDGPARIHDRFRVDKKGGATYAQTIEGVKLLLQGWRAGQIPSLSCLVVIQPDSSAAEVYRHIVHDLGFRMIDFLLPDVTHDKGLPSARSVGKYLCELFDCWTSEKGELPKIRFLESAVSLFMGGRSYLGGFGPELPVAFTVLSDGTLQGDDYLRPCGDAVCDLGMHLDSDSFSSALEKAQGMNILLKVGAIPMDCIGCAFEKVCRGGQPTQRFTEERLFDNRSAYCEGLKTFYERVCVYLLSSGMRLEHLEHVLRRGPAGHVEFNDAFGSGQSNSRTAVRLNPRKERLRDYRALRRVA